MSSTYIDLAIDTDPQDIFDDFVSYMQSVIPGWNPGVGNLDTWLAMAISLAAAETRDVASSVPKSIFRYFGATLINLPPINATPATVLTDWTVQDTAGYLIPAGTQVAIAATGDVSYAFETLADTTIAPGGSTATGVVVQAVTPGAASSSLGSIGGTVQLLDPLSYVTAITQEQITSGGLDAETDDVYLTRLAKFLQLLAPRPILPSDFAEFARNIAGVQRATAIDGYDPASGGSFNNARTIAIAAVDSNGLAVSSSVKTAMQADLQSRREVNFIVNVIDPTVNLIDVTYQVQSDPGQDTTALVAAINAALTAYLSPVTWGAGTDPNSWTNNLIVRYLEIATLINNVPGVSYITTTSSNYDLRIDIHGGSLARTDITLTGVAPLPTANILTGVAL